MGLDKVDALAPDSGWLSLSAAATGGLGSLGALQASLEVGEHLSSTWSAFGDATATLDPGSPFGWQAMAGARATW